MPKKEVVNTEVLVTELQNLVEMLNDKFSKLGNEGIAVNLKVHGLIPGTAQMSDILVWVSDVKVNEIKKVN